MKFKHFILLIVITSFMLIKVYVANELYYTSKDIQKLLIQINALKEERNLLKLKIEKLKYKNTIIDPLFEYKPKEIQPSKEISIKELQEESKPIEQTTKPPKREHKDTKELFKNINLDIEQNNTQIKEEGLF